MTCGCGWNTIGWKATNKPHVRRRKNIYLVYFKWDHKKMEWIEMLHVRTQKAWAVMYYHTRAPYAPHVGKKKEQSVLSNWLPINTKLSAEGKAPNFEKEFQHTKQNHKSSLIFSLSQCSKNCSFVLSSF